MQYKKLLLMLWHNNTTWDENLIGKTTVDGEEVIDTVAKEAVAWFQEWISDVPRLKELRFKRYEPGHLEHTTSCLCVGLRSNQSDIEHALTVGDRRSVLLWNLRVERVPD